MDNSANEMGNREVEREGRESVSRGK